MLTNCELALATALAIVLPAVKHLYCLWHIEKNIAKIGLTGDKFNNFMHDWKTSIVQAETEERLEEGINSLRSRCIVKPQFVKIMEYIDKLLHDKQSYVRAWTDQYCHLGPRNTSRIEGAHRAMKDTLNHSNGTLYTVIIEVQRGGDG